MKTIKAVCGILVFTLVLAVQGQSLSSFTNGLVAYYPFLGNAKDASGNGNNLINYGATLCSDRFGTSNQAYSFNGSSYLGSSTPVMTQIDNWTLSAWLLPASLNQNLAFVVCVGENAQLNNGFGFGISGGNQLYAFYSGLSAAPDNYPFTATNQWHQVVMVRSSGVATFYVDGVMTPTSFQTTPLGPPTQFEIGSAGNAEPTYFMGAIDDVRVYARPLPTSEVQELFEFEALDVPTPQAVATADITNGFVVDVSVTYGGYGYTSIPTVTLTGGGGEGAQAEAVVSNGIVVGVDMLDAGSGYSNAPVVAIESPVDFHPFAANATPDVTNGFVVGATITYGGYGYTNTPIVKIVGGGGSGAQAVAVVSNGQVVAINFLDAGHGYLGIPVVVIAPPFIPQPTLGLGPVSLLSFTNLEVGVSYQFQLFSDSVWANLGEVFNATNSIFIQYVGGASAPNSYRLATTPLHLQAFATAQVVDGFVIGATVTNGGTGYVAAPAVNISGPGGSNATAGATVTGGSVTGITIMDAGNNYTTATITIAPPPASALSPSATPAWQLNMGSLSPYQNYQLEFTQNLSGTWGNFGSPFTAATTTNTFYPNLNGAGGFFRLVYLP